MQDLHIKPLKKLRPKKKWYCFRKSVGWKFFHHLPARISQMCMRIYTFFASKKHTHKQTKFY